MRWKAAYAAGIAPPVMWEFTQQKALAFMTLAQLKLAS